jgi:hypothetical protein
MNVLFVVCEMPTNICDGRAGMIAVRVVHDLDRIALQTFDGERHACDIVAIKRNTVPTFAGFFSFPSKNRG